MVLEQAGANAWQTSNSDFEFTDMGIWVEPIPHTHELCFADQTRFTSVQGVHWTGVVAIAGRLRIAWAVEDGT